jgi:fluoride ion exporter CrcB/FEX
MTSLDAPTVRSILTPSEDYLFPSFAVGTLAVNCVGVALSKTAIHSSALIKNAGVNNQLIPKKNQS